MGSIFRHFPYCLCTAMASSVECLWVWSVVAASGAAQALELLQDGAHHFARLKMRLGVNVPCGVAIEAEVCISSSPFNVTEALRASPSKFGVVARSAV